MLFIIKFSLKFVNRLTEELIIQLHCKKSAADIPDNGRKKGTLFLYQWTLPLQ